MRRPLAEQAKVVRGGHQPAPEMPAPHAVHHHPRGERILFIGNPLGQSQPTAVFVAKRFAVGQYLRKPPRLLEGRRRIVVAAQKHRQLRSVAVSDAHGRHKRRWIILQLL